MDHELKEIFPIINHIPLFGKINHRKSYFLLFFAILGELSWEQNNLARFFSQ